MSRLAITDTVTFKSSPTEGLVKLIVSASQVSGLGLNINPLGFPFREHVKASKTVGDTVV